MQTDKKVSVSNYAKESKYSRDTIIKKLRKGEKLPNIEKYELIGVTWILHRKAPKNEHRVSVLSYAQKRNISKQAVLKRLRKNLPLIYVTKAEKIGALWELTVNY